MEESFSKTGKLASDGFQVSVNVLFVPVDPVTPPFESRIGGVIHLLIFQVLTCQEAISSILDQLCDVVPEEG